MRRLKRLEAEWEERKGLGVAGALFALTRGTLGMLRASTPGMLSDNQFSYLFRQMNAQRIRKVEPLDELFAVNRPTMLAQGLRMLVEHGVHTRAQIETSLGLNLRDVEAIAGLPEGFLDQRVVPIRFRADVLP